MSRLTREKFCSTETAREAREKDERQKVEQKLPCAEDFAALRSVLRSVLGEAEETVPRREARVFSQSFCFGQV